MLTALTREVSPGIGECALSYMERDVIDARQARRQHAAYEDGLRRLGAEVIRLASLPEYPDGAFVEDTAVVVDELAVITAPCLPSRRPEVESTAEVLARFRPLVRLVEPATLEGGDVMRIGRTVYVGRSTRTNADGARQLAAFLAPHGYQVRTIPVASCLHLKTACTDLGRNTVLINPTWVDACHFAGHTIIEVAPGEPFAANALTLGDRVLFPASFPLTRARLEDQGFQAETVDISELQKAEAGLTCCSIVFET